LSAQVEIVSEAGLIAADIHRLAESISGGKAEPVREALIQIGLKRIVIAADPIGAQHRACHSAVKNI
jgi:hypothetical protein